MSKTPAATDTATRRKPSTKWVLQIVFLVLLALAGLGLTDFAPEKAEWYWVVILPVFGLVGMWMTAGHRKEGQKLWPAIRTQVYHWLGFAIAIKLMFLLVHTGTLDRNASGLVALILLFLTTFYSGLLYDKRYLLVSALLAVAVAACSYVDEYMWILLVILAVILLILIPMQLRRARKPHEPQVESSAESSAERAESNE